MKVDSHHYSGFDYAASELYQFIAVEDLFSIILDNGDIVKFTPNDAAAFKDWLLENGVTDIRSLDGWVINENEN